MGQRGDLGSSSAREFLGQNCERQGLGGPRKLFFKICAITPTDNKKEEEQKRLRQGQKRLRQGQKLQHFPRAILGAKTIETGIEVSVAKEEMGSKAQRGGEGGSEGRAP